MPMPGLRGHVAFAVQGTAKVSGSFSPGAYSFIKHPAIGFDGGVVENNDALPPEVGGGLFVNTTYATGAMAAGNLSLVPRLQGAIGHLLYGLAGAYSSAAGAAGPPATTATHTFKVGTDDTYLPFMVFRRYVPGATATTGITEYFYDAKIDSARFVLPARGTLGAQFTFAGRKPFSADNETSTGSANESGVGLGLSCVGAVKLPGLGINGITDGTFAGATITVANNLSTAQESIVGDYFPEDLVPLSRAVEIRLLYRWKNPSLYKSLFYNGTAGDWSPVIKTSDVIIEAKSADNIASFSHPYVLTFSAPNVDWVMAPPSLTAQQLLQAEVVGTLKTTASSTPTWQFDLKSNATYSFPS